METKKYWYSDNWYGTLKEFKTLLGAKRHAKKNNAGSVTIHGKCGGVWFVDGVLPIPA